MAAAAQKPMTRASKDRVTAGGALGLTVGERQDEALGQELADDSPAARAKRRTNGELARADGRAREQQAGDVRAADQEHDADDAEEEEGRQL